LWTVRSASHCFISAFVAQIGEAEPPAQCREVLVSGLLPTGKIPDICVPIMH
jgi:hypothetical protein